jgi:hypothetical protein
MKSGNVYLFSSYAVHKKKNISFSCFDQKLLDSCSQHVIAKNECAASMRFGQYSVRLAEDLGSGTESPTFYQHNSLIYIQLSHTSVVFTDMRS